MYRLYDAYDSSELLGEAETMKEVAQICRQRDDDTDGEWLPVLYLDGELVDEWSY